MQVHVYVFTSAGMHAAHVCMEVFLSSSLYLLRQDLLLNLKFPDSS